MPPKPQGKKQAATEAPAAASSASSGLPTQSNPTPSDVANHILKVLDDIITPPNGKRASITVTHIQEVRTKVQTLVNLLSNQPSPAELMKAIQATKNDVNIKTAEILQVLPKRGETWASVAAAAAPKAPVPAIPRATVEQKSAEANRKSKDIVIKLNDPDVIKEYRSKTPITILGKVNSALATCGHPQIQTCRALAAKQLRSGDICVSFASDTQASNLRNFQSHWIAALSPRATVNRQTDGVLVHGIHTETFSLHDPETIGKLFVRTQTVMAWKSLASLG